MNYSAGGGGSWPPPHVDNQNFAEAGANVGQQNAVNYGDTAFHNESIYHINQGDPPERRTEVARNFLVAGVPREAERLFGELLRHGHITTERAYYYVLSAVSGRSCSDVDVELFKNVRDARKMVQSLPQDRWQDALGVVWRLMRFVQGEVQGEICGENLEVVLDAFTTLPSDRQDEIALHLAMILSGATQSRLEAVYAHRVVTQRMSNGRLQRAWKFFETEPARPRKYVAADVKAEQQAWVRAVGGSAAVGIGVLVILAAPTVLSALVALPLLVVGGYLLLRHGVERVATTLWAQIRRSQVAPPARPVEPRSPGHWVSTKFVQEIHRIVDSRFTEARPHGTGDWPGYTAGIRAHLKVRFVELYGNAQVTAGAVSWLARWHARQVAAGWGANALYQPAARTSERDTVMYRVGVGIAAAGLVLLLASGGLGAAVFIGAGGFFAAKGLTRIRSLKRMTELSRAHDERTFVEETRGYDEWVQFLADRPSDGEMARWLAMDKVYLKNDLVKRNSLTTHDLVMDVVMTEGANGAMRARVLHGPPRYSKYEVQVFLLTRGGVEGVRLELDFLTGEALNEQSINFPYGALASASVNETGVRATRGEGEHTREVERLRSRRLCLTLVNGRDVAVVAENFRNANDSMLEDDSELFLVALQTSGIDAALPVLKAVAREGSDWIAREQERREQWFREWYE